jgi:hypothetical protein
MDGKGIYEKVRKEIKNAKAVMERKQEIIFCVTFDSTCTVYNSVQWKTTTCTGEKRRCGGYVDIAIIFEIREMSVFVLCQRTDLHCHNLLWLVEL